MNFYYDISIRVDEETYQWLRMMAGAEGLTVPEYLVRLLRALRDFSTAVEKSYSPPWKGNGRSY